MSLINKALMDLERRQGGAQAEVAPEVRLAPAARSQSVAPVLIGLALAVGGGVAGTWLVMRDAAPVQVAAVRNASVPAAPAVVGARAPAVVAAPASTVALVAAAPVVAPAPAPAAAAAASAPAVARAAAPASAEVTAAATPARAAPIKMAAASVAQASVAPAAASPVARPPLPGLAATSYGAVMKPTNVIAFPGVLKTPLLAPEAATPKPIAASPVLVAAVEPKMEKTVSPAQLSSNLQAQASALLQQGNGIEARPLLRRALQANPANSAARQQLADLLVEGNALAEAAALLREGVQLTPERSGLWMSLARLELEQGSAPSAMATLEKGLVHAGQDAQYNAFYAVLLQRAGRHDQAVTHYITALRADPSMPNWLVGAGISLQALGKNADALEAFVRARDGGRLQGTLFAFVEQRIEQLK